MIARRVTVGHRPRRHCVRIDLSSFDERRNRVLGDCAMWLCAAVLSLTFVHVFAAAVAGCVAP